MVCATGCPKSPNIILYYIILYYITLFYGFNILVFCNLHCIYIYIYMRMQYMRQCFYEQGHQCKLPRVITPSASRVFALVEGRKKPPAQVAEGQGGRAPVSIGMQWGTTMYASTVLVLVEAQVGAGCSNRYATCTWAEHGSHIVPKCKLHTCCCILLQLVPFD